MDFQIKLLHLQDRGNYLIALTRGSLDVEGFEELFRQIKDAATTLLHYKILVDLADAACHLDSMEIDRLINELSDFWFGENRVALISPSDVGQYNRLSSLREQSSQSRLQGRSLRRNESRSRLVSRKISLLLVAAAPSHTPFEACHITRSRTNIR